ncbi:MAG: peptide chain release factor N(5)-glutamine methyltransferase [Rubrimonas sp.]
MTRAELLRWAARRLDLAAVPDAARDARVLLRWAAGLSPARFTASLTEVADGSERERFEAAVARREARVPVSHIVGERLFWGRPFHVSGAVLDPRPETETLIEVAMKGGPASRVLDLGVGSGCILLTLLAEWPCATGLGVDASEAALAVAARNAADLGLADRARLQSGDWLIGIDSRFDLIVSNPPYLSDADMLHLSPELRNEPLGALHGGADGLAAYRRIAAGLRAVLAPFGRVLLEVGAGQADDVAALLRAEGISRVEVALDMDGRDRVVSGWRD